VFIEIKVYILAAVFGWNFFCTAFVQQYKIRSRRSVFIEKKSNLFGWKAACQFRGQKFYHPKTQSKISWAATLFVLLQFGKQSVRKDLFGMVAKTP